MSDELQMNWPPLELGLVCYILGLYSLVLLFMALVMLAEKYPAKETWADRFFQGRPGAWAVTAFIIAWLVFVIPLLIANRLIPGFLQALAEDAGGGESVLMEGSK